MNISNKLTILRIMLTPIFIAFLLIDFIPNRFVFALITFIIASITDHLDGRLARKHNEITNFGKFLDPLADKILTMSAFICFIDLHIISAVPVIIILIREFIVTSIRLVASSAGKIIPANIWGKVKTVSQIITIIIVLCTLSFFQIYEKNFAYYFHLIQKIGTFTIWISVIITVVSGAKYVVDNLEFIKN